jgi:hypothetical protein
MPADPQMKQFVDDDIFQTRSGFLASSRLHQTRREAGLQLPHLVFIFLTPQAAALTPRIGCHFSNSEGISALRCSRYQG